MKKVLAVIAIVLAFSISSTAFADDKYKISAPAVYVKKGVKTTAFVTFTSAGGFRINIEYPFKIALTADSGVQLEKTTLLKTDATEWKKEVVKFPIVFTATQTGRKLILGQAKFAVATDNDNVPQVVTVAINVFVN